MNNNNILSKLNIYIIKNINVVNVLFISKIK